MADDICDRHETTHVAPIGQLGGKRHPDAALVGQDEPSGRLVRGSLRRWPIERWPLDPLQQVEPIRPALSGTRGQRLRGQLPERQAFERRRPAPVFAVDGNIDGDRLRIVLRRSPHGVRPDLARARAVAAEALDADRQVGVAQRLRRLLEVAVVLDQRGVDVQAGIEQRGVQSLHAVHGNVRRQSHPRQRLIGAAPEFLDGTKRRTILQTGTVQGLVIKLGRNLVATAELDLLEG